jgi:hypothetical protein
MGLIKTPRGTASRFPRAVAGNPAVSGSLAKVVKNFWRVAEILREVERIGPRVAKIASGSSENFPRSSEMFRRDFLAFSRRAKTFRGFAEIFSWTSV